MPEIKKASKYIYQVWYDGQEEDNLTIDIRSICAIEGTMIYLSAAMSIFLNDDVMKVVKQAWIEHHQSIYGKG